MEGVMNAASDNNLDREHEPRKQLCLWLQNAVLPRIQEHHAQDPAGEVRDILDALEAALTGLGTGASEHASSVQ
jgi:hypothetical protein